MQSVKIFADGACRGNPGPGGYGVIIRGHNSEGGILQYSISGGYDNTTNNRMELLAVIVGLEHVDPPASITIVTDSTYVAKSIETWLPGWVKNGWKLSSGKPVKNKDLWQRFLEASKGKRIVCTWVKGHAGHPENERCDEMAVKASHGSNLPEDMREAV